MENVLAIDIPAEAGASLRLQVPPDGRFGRYVRERVARFAASLRVPDMEALEFLTAVSEALANAIEHSRCQDTIEVRCWIVADEQLYATVVDHGVGFDAAPRVAAPELPDALDERGRGLPIMKRCTDVFTVRSLPGKGTAVILGRNVRKATGGSGYSAAG
ncbi:MAG: hypothetical protein NVS3B7_13010 [Candidatus Elarobacter sp.]